MGYPTVGVSTADAEDPWAVANGGIQSCQSGNDGIAGSSMAAERLDDRDDHAAFLIIVCSGEVDDPV